MTEFRRPFAGRAIGLSISESDDSTALGFPDWQVNRVTLQVVSALLGQGAGIVFGHDWRDDGVMEAVHGLALRTEPSIASSLTTPSGPALLQNILPWPDTPRLSGLDQERLASTVRVEQAGLPSDLASVAEEALRGAEGRTPLFRYCRARALTHVRRILNARSDARICLGGRRRGASGRYPGVIEEALFAVESGRPLFVAGLLGGASRQIIDAFLGKPMPADFCRTKLTDIYEHPPTPIATARTTGERSDATIDRESVWTTFQTYGVNGCARASGLSADRMVELFDTPVFDRAVQIALSGLASLFVLPDDAPSS